MIVARMVDSAGIATVKHPDVRDEIYCTYTHYIFEIGAQLVMMVNFLQYVYIYIYK